MKKIETITTAAHFAEVRRALADAAIDAFTVSEVKGFSHTNTHKQTFRGNEFSVEYQPRIKIEIILENHEVSGAVQALMKNASSPGEQKLFLYDIEDPLTVDLEELVAHAH